MKKCSVRGCQKPVKTRGWCDMHYMRWWATGNLGRAAPTKGPRITFVDRFWSKVDRRKSKKPCWEWLATKTNGYGMFSVDGKSRGAHCVAYELLIGPIPEGMELDHLCRNRGCTNPYHCEPVPPKENKLRGEGIMARQARQTHCLRGHPLVGPDALLKPDPRFGRRICLLCVRINRRERYKRLGR